MTNSAIFVTLFWSSFIEAKRLILLLKLRQFTWTRRSWHLRNRGDNMVRLLQISSNVKQTVTKCQRNYLFQSSEVYEVFWNKSNYRKLLNITKTNIANGNVFTVLKLKILKFSFRIIWRKKIENLQLVIKNCTML